VSVRAVALVVLGLTLIGCKQESPKPPTNVCDSDADCGKSGSCDLERKLCILARVEEPYSIVIQVTTQSGGATKLRRHTFNGTMLEASRTDLNLSIPAGMRVQGFVGTQGDDAREPLEAEVTFTPISAQKGLPVSIVTTNSRLGDAVSNVQATLAPDTRYNVKVIPLGVTSRKLPPREIELDTAKANRFELVFPALDLFEGIVLDESMKPAAGRWVRIVSNDAARVRSSIGIVEPEGALSLYVDPGVLAAGNYHFEFALDTSLPFQSVIEVDRARVDSMRDNTIIIPRIPRFVTFVGLVEESEDVDAKLAGTELTFESDFPIPDVPGEVGDRDFCRSTVLGDKLPPFKCRSVRRTTTDDLGRFSLPLLPGDYRVFLSPPKEGAINRATTQEAVAVIATQAGDASQEGQLYKLKTGSRYPGAARSADGSEMSNVVVRALALGLPALLGPFSNVAVYNRSSEALTDDQGQFVLAVDPGYYDLVARPPVMSGFAWAYVKDVLVNAASGSLGPLTFLFQTPVLLAGTLDSEGIPEAMASIDAYAIVPGIDGKRALLIGQTSTDDLGKFSLFLTPEILSGQDTVQPGDAGSE